MIDEKSRLEAEINELKRIRQSLKLDIIELDDERLFQEFGLYQPQYNFAKLEDYKNRLEEIKAKQKEMIMAHTAVICETNWKLQGDEQAGKKFIAEGIKQILRNFNIECDLVISKVKFSNYQSSKDRIIKSFEIQNKFNEASDIKITDEYLRLKVEELNLAFEYQEKRQIEKEKISMQKEEERENALLAKELEEKRRDLEKEQTHYQNHLNKILSQLSGQLSEEKREYLENKKEELLNQLDEIECALIDLDYREANQRAGYVYIISNIGAFGDNIYKIGMTRRLDPTERIAELSGASVPFKFDIHAMIFSDDAPKLESDLHNHFNDKKVNLVNGRKEFFNVSLDEIKQVVCQYHDKTVDFIDIPDAEQYRKTLMMKK